jgi:hypothetical protein
MLGVKLALMITLVILVKVMLVLMRIACVSVIMDLGLIILGIARIVMILIVRSVRMTLRIVRFVLKGTTPVQVNVSPAIHRANLANHLKTAQVANKTQWVQTIQKNAFA